MDKKIDMEEIPRKLISWNDFKEETERNQEGNFFYRGLKDSSYCDEGLLTSLQLTKETGDNDYCSQAYHNEVLEKAKELKLSGFEKVPSCFPIYAPSGLLMYPSEKSEEVYLTSALMIHLRHHRFRSPLLDWSKNPLKSAYFAFTKEKNVAKEPEFVSIVRLEKKSNPTKNTINSLSFTLGEQLVSLIDLRNSHWKEISQKLHFSLLNRHKLQEAAYTLCYVRDDFTVKTGKIKYSMAKPSSLGRFKYIRDLEETNCRFEFIRYDLPVTDREIILEELDKCWGINAVTLGLEEDEEVETEAYQQEHERLLA